MSQWSEHSPPINVAQGSNPGVDAICWLSLLLVLSLALRGFSPGSPVFPSSQKPTFPNSNSPDQELGRRRTTKWICYLKIVIYLFLICCS